MSEPEEPAEAPEPKSPELVEVTVQVPASLLAAYDHGVAQGYYASRGEAIRHGLTESWRHHRGRYCTVRLDLLDPDDKRPDTSSAAPESDETREGDDGEDGDEGENS